MSYIYVVGGLVLLRLCLCYSVVASLIVFGDCVAVMCYDWFVGVLLVNDT